MPWCDMPENALYKVFESLLQDKQDATGVSRWLRDAGASCQAIYQAGSSRDCPLPSPPPLHVRTGLAPQFRSAAACCRTWRLASQEVMLDDTAASRPEL